MRIWRLRHVIRGEDHVGNTPKQILLYEALGMEVPVFAHTPLILNESGAKLSKRDGVTSIGDFQEMGFTAEALANYMTLLGLVCTRYAGAVYPRRSGEAV